MNISRTSAATARAPPIDHEAEIREQARQRRIELETLSDFGLAEPGRGPALVLGYAQMPEAAIRAGIRQLAEAIGAARRG